MFLKSGRRQKDFRPLDGESFSKLDEDTSEKMYLWNFRPLDGESFSKPLL